MAASCAEPDLLDGRVNRLPGGGVAALLALLWLHRFNSTADSVSVVGAMAENETLSVVSGSLVASVVHGADIVPPLSLGMLTDFKVMTRTLSDSRNRGVAEKIITKALGLDRSGSGVSGDAEHNMADPITGEPRAVPHEGDWLWSLMQTLRAEMASEKLYPPGTVYWLRTKAYVKRTTQVSATASGSSAAVQQQTRMPSTMALSWPFASSLTPPAAGQSATAAGVAAARATVTREERRYLAVLDRLEDVDDLVGELRFSRSMFTDHNPRFYEDGIRALELGVAGHSV
ncbi:hypothetical protein H9P43_002825 [Blastocladiella emersonii ATCC 22665]|nr:hypothetical protein H9P43_002825 [Blastocladiella emersonii ATCC 22665]